VTREWTAARIAILATLLAATAVLTMIVRVPIAPTRGYIHLGDVGVYFAAFVFGPAMGFLVGGLGTALADVLGGYAHWAPLTFLFHGSQGLVAACIGYRRVPARQVLGWSVGSIIMIGGYFLAEVVLYGAGAALVELPGNVIQAVVGGVIAVPLAAATRRAWPPINEFGEPRTWEER